MKHAVEMGSGAIPNFIKIGSGTQTDRQINRPTDSMVI
jgi:hypothetical protein